MKKSISALIVGNVVNISLGAKLFKKNCGTPEEANELYTLVMEARENPTDEKIQSVRAYLNEKLRVAFLTGLENDPETGNVFLAGFNTPIPIELVSVIEEYHENGHPMDALLNFWKLLMLNPDVAVRESLFGFIGKHDFSVTENGYMVVYKAVAQHNEHKNNPLSEFVAEKHLHVKKNWSKSPNAYGVYMDVEGNFAITKWKTIEKWNRKGKTFECYGKLGDLYDAITVEDSKTAPTYTDKHTRTMKIEVGTPIEMDRTKCDADANVGCSYGLHVGATSYVESYANNGDTVLVCLVNPAHVVAVPTHDNSKMRVSEYFPFAIAKYEDNKIDVIEEKFFEHDYVEYETETLEAMVEKIQANEKPIATAKKAEEETRPMSELKKILESRLIDLG